MLPRVLKAHLQKGIKTTLEHCPSLNQWVDILILPFLFPSPRPGTYYTAAYVSDISKKKVIFSTFFLSFASASIILIWLLRGCSSVFHIHFANLVTAQYCSCCTYHFKLGPQRLAWRWKRQLLQWELLQWAFKLQAQCSNPHTLAQLYVTQLADLHSWSVLKKIPIWNLFLCRGGQYFGVTMWLTANKSKAITQP